MVLDNIAPYGERIKTNEQQFRYFVDKYGDELRLTILRPQHGSYMHYMIILN